MKTRLSAGKIRCVRKRVRCDVCVPVNQILKQQSEKLQAAGLNFVCEVPKHDNVKSIQWLENEKL